MPLRVQIDPGGEKFFSFARNKLRDLKAFMAKTSLKVMSKHFYVSENESIWIKTTRLRPDLWMDWIRIKSDLGVGGFVIYPRIEFLGTGAVFAPGSPVLLSLDCGKITAPFSGLSQVGPPYRNTDGRVLAAYGSGYYDMARRVTKAVPTSYLPFVHAYEESVGGQMLQRSRTLAAQVYASTPVILDLGVDVPQPIPISGGGHEIHDISPDGRRAVSLVGDTRADFTLNYAASPQVSVVATVLDGYGSITRVVSDANSYSSNVVESVGTDGNTSSSSYSEGSLATYPVCYGYDEASVRREVTYTVSTSVTGSMAGSWSRTQTGPPPPQSPDGFTSFSASTEYSSARIAVVALPNGRSREFIIESGAYAYNTSGSTVFVAGNTVSSTSSASYPEFSLVKGTLDILYADASLPAVIYRYVRDTYVGPPPSGTITRETTVAAMVVSKEYPIFSGIEEGLAQGAIPQATPSFGPANTANYSTGSNSTTPINTTAISPPKARQQSAVGVSIKDEDRLVWQYQATDGTYQVGGHKDPLPTVRDYLAAAIVGDFIAPAGAQLSAADTAQFLLDLGVTSDRLQMLMESSGYTEAQANSLESAFGGGVAQGIENYATTVASPAGIGLI